jgi:p-cumate 2,3-dioxygenase beta subunit
MSARANTITRAEVEDFLYAEAALLDDWRLDDWLGLLTDDATYQIPSNDRPDSDPRTALFTIADDMDRIRARVKRLKDVNAHAESPRSRTRRMIANVRILDVTDGALTVTANFVVNRFRRGSPTREYVGHYRYTLVTTPDGLRIRSRRAVLDAAELGELGAVSFIL